jgi:hypothetical protein
MYRASGTVESEWLKAFLGLRGDSGSGASSSTNAYTNPFADIGAD